MLISPIRYMPEAMRERVYYRLFNSCRAHQLCAPLFRQVRLAHAPTACMRDLVLGDIISGNIALTGFYERALSLEIRRLAKAGGTLVDVGANMGYFSLVWLAANPQNRVVAVEASPGVADRLEHNIGTNRFVDRTRIVRAAAGPCKGSIEFDVGDGIQTGWGGIASGSTNYGVTVPQVAIDDVLDGIERIDVLKIDTEGYDCEVLRGCERVLRRHVVGRIYFEQNSARMAALGVEPGAAAKFLASVGYRATPLFGQDEWIATPIKS